MPITGDRFSELPLGGFPIHELLFPRLNEPVPFGQNIAVPSRRSDLLAGQLGPEVFHQPKLVWGAHLLKVNCCWHEIPVAEGGTARKLRCCAGSNATKVVQSTSSRIERTSKLTGPLMSAKEFDRISSRWADAPRPRRKAACSAKPSPAPTPKLHDNLPLPDSFLGIIRAPRVVAGDPPDLVQGLRKTFKLYS